MAKLAILISTVFLFVPTAIAWGVTSNNNMPVDIGVFVSTVKYVLSMFVTVSVALIGTINGLAIFIFLSTTKRLDRNVSKLFEQLDDVKKSTMSFEAHDRICNSGHGRKSAR